MGWVQAALSALLLVGSIHTLTASVKGEFTEEMAVQAREEAEGIADEYERFLRMEKRDAIDEEDADIEKRDINPEMEYEDEDVDMEEKRDINPEDEEDGGSLGIEKRGAPVFRPILVPPPAPQPTPPPNTIGSARRVSFDYSTDVETVLDQFSFNASDGGLRFLDNSLDDEYSSEWSMVTPEGYEYEGSPVELKKLFVSARLSPKAPGYDASVFVIGEPTGDGPDFTIAPTTTTSSATRPTSSSATRPTSSPGGPDPIITPIGDHFARIQRSVFGTDTRVKVTTPTQFPWAAMGKIGSGCTGTFIGPRHILTAGHCVYSQKTKKWLKNLNFRRGKNCHPNQGTLYKWKWAITVKGWKKYGWQSYDYAMIVVDTPSPYYMSYGWKKPIPKWTVNIAGYPGDKPGRCMWRTHCKIRNRFTKRLGYKCDTYGGMNGSAVYTYRRSSNRRIIYCIHAYGKTSSKNYNKCTRITESRFNQFKSWIQNY